MGERTWFLVDDGKAMPRWCELRPAETLVWIDAKARTWPRDAARPLAHVTGETIECTLDSVPAEITALERDFAVERLLDPWSDQGWVSPRGVFYGCAYYAHDDIAFALLRRPSGALEHEGYVRVHADSFRTGPTAPVRMTPAQRRTLEALGFDVESIRRVPYAADRSGRAPAFAYAPRGRFPLPAGVAEEPGDPGLLKEVVDRLRADEALAHLFEAAEPDLVTDLGGGNWEWLLSFPDLDLGSGERPSDLVDAVGLYLSSPAWGQVEVTAWHVPGTHVHAGAERVLAEARRDSHRGPAGP